MLEYGGEFSTPGELPPGALLRDALPGATLWGSGRAALLALLEARKWRRIWLPTYMCPEVVTALRVFPVERYLDHPLLSPAGLPARTEPGDVVIRVNFFGLRGAEEIERSQGDVIEDHTHDPVGPWARGSRATYALASLRKTFPAPDGGALWSPQGAAVPLEREPTAAHLAAADAKLMAMDWKAQRLRGRPVAKEEHRRLSAAGEERIGSLSGIHPDTRTLLGRASPVGLAAARRRAFEQLAGATPWTVAPRGDPFALVLDLADARRRDRVLRALVAESVYPSVLWPLPWWGSERSSRAVSRRLLTVSCDFRYRDEHVAEVGRLLAALASAPT